ncbi:hypothetical protein B0H14DRAFT_2625789 [Mycena olivaceomarginata]|nr:hypothetical protein B0H14DRAFT_2625789 [Mycena olivaceomarginata]
MTSNVDSSGRRHRRTNDDRLRQTVEGLKPKPLPTTDKKSAFWSAYKTLADEHDKELLQRYSTDLDTSLIFAGLFSAVDSAFIIQIQPAFQSSDSGSSQPSNPSLLILVAQSLLFVSLGSTLLAALLAVLGKQWLMYYSAAGERGTVETRGLERQRKLDGLRKWEFDTIMQIFPLLLQFGLFLFASGLSVFLWRINLVLALIVLGLTSLGTLAYILLLASAVVFPDSPFQTPLAPLIPLLVPSPLRRKLKAASVVATSSLCILSLEPDPIFDCSLFEPSLEVPAVSWVLETSTDPNTVTLAADLAADLQWPSTMDVAHQMIRVRDQFLGCFDHSFEDGAVVLHGVRDGAYIRAIQLGRAYGTLRCITSISDPIPSFTDFSNLGTDLQQIIDVLRAPLRSLSSLLGSVDRKPLALEWALHVIPSLLPHRNEELSRGQFEYFLVREFDNQMSTLSEPSSFADYLFFVNTFLSRRIPNSRDAVWIDKRSYTSSAGKDAVFNLWYDSEEERRSIIYNFCGSVPRTAGWFIPVLAACRWTINHFGEPPHHGLRHHAAWVHSALRDMDISMTNYAQWDGDTMDGFDALLQALNYYDEPPSKESIKPILRALSEHEHVSIHVVRSLLRADVFQDEELRPILQNAHVWSSITHRVIQSRKILNETLLNPLEPAISVQEYITLGNNLSSTIGFHSDLRKELCSWINIFFSLKTWTHNVAETYSSALANICGLSLDGYTPKSADEHAFGLTLAALANFWDNVDFTASGSFREALMWLDCSICVLLRCGHGYDEHQWRMEFSPTTTKFDAMFSEPLHKSLAHATTAARQEIEVCRSSGFDSMWQERMQAFESIAQILDEMSNILPRPTNTEKDCDYWDTMGCRLKESVQALKKSGRLGLLDRK